MEYTIHFDPQIYFALIPIGAYYVVRAVNALFMPLMIGNVLKALVSVQTSS